MVDVGFEPTTQKIHGPSTTPFVKVICGGILVRLTTCKRLVHSLPKLSLNITRTLEGLKLHVLGINRNRSNPNPNSVQTSDDIEITGEGQQDWV